jgi:hypothetical protein
VSWYVLAEEYTDRWKLLPFVTNHGLGVVVFEDEERAEAFIETNWQVLGPGWRPFELYSDRLAYVLEWYAEQEGVEWVVLDPPAVPVAEAAGPKQVEAAEVRRFLEVLRGL